jgi:hypothetical protein
LLPDGLLVLGGDAFLTPLLNGSQPMLEGVHVAWEVRFCLSFPPFVSSYAARFIFPQVFAYGKVMAK